MKAAFLGLVMPWLMLSGVIFIRQEQPEPEPQTVQTTVEDPGDIWILVRNADGSVLEQPLESYLVGVVLAEMPGSFEPEALKAQAVAARTYTCKALRTGGKHGDGSVCKASSCCQAWMEETEYASRGGEDAALSRIHQAVQDTAGWVLTYGDELIEATYFSCSGGTTEDAAAVWGTEFPYLISVSSPGEEKAAWYEDTVAFSPKGFQEALGQEFSGSPESWFGLTEYTKGGGVKSMFISGQPFTGIQLRSLLNLRSTAFWAEVKNGQILIHTKGYGHRVGMSQYGADAMAVGGSSWQEILAHYYPGTTPKRLILDENGELVYDQ